MNVFTNELSSFDSPSGADLSFDVMSELGRSGLVRFSGYVLDEYIKELQGVRGMRLYREMKDSDPIIAAMLYAFNSLMQSVSWNVEAASRDAEDVFLADFVRSNMDDMCFTWTETLSEILTMLPFGWSLHEDVYKIRRGVSPDNEKSSRHDDGLIGWSKLPGRAQESLFRWSFDDNGRVLAMEQRAAPDFQLRTIPLEKATLFRTSAAKNNPEGHSLLRGAYKPWYFKKQIERIEAIGIERDLAGLPVAFVPPELLSATATDSQKSVLAQIQRIVTNIRNDEQSGLVFPMAYTPGGQLAYDIRLLNTGGRRNFDTNAIVERYDKRILMTAMADMIMVGQSSGGSYALMDQKVNLFEKGLDGFLDAIANHFNRGPIPKLIRVNGWSPRHYPKLTHGRLNAPSLTEMAKLITAAAGAGFTINGDALEGKINERLGLLQDAQDDPEVGQ